MTRLSICICNINLNSQSGFFDYNQFSGIVAADCFLGIFNVGTKGMTLINDEEFSDVYITPQKEAFIWSRKTPYGLRPVVFDDYEEFLAEVEKGYEGEPSYLIIYKSYNYRVERTNSLYGVQYCVRKMPRVVPDFKNLGFPPIVASHLCSLGRATGLLLVSGATGSGKSTTLASLLKEFLSKEGGYAFTIENPIEMPLDGIYRCPSGDFGLCKQTSAPGGQWEEGLKSALRSAPRYILLGEIRTPDVACLALQAAMSGHLIFPPSTPTACPMPSMRWSNTPVPAASAKKWPMNWWQAVCSAAFTRCWSGCRKN